MKKTTGLLLIIALTLNACVSAPPESIDLPADISNTSIPIPYVEIKETSIIKRSLPLKVTWQIQYSGKMDYSLNVDMYNLDLFDTGADVIAQLHKREIFVMCYFSAGSLEDWRPDAKKFSPNILGKEMEDWEGEKWLDIRQIESLKPIIIARLDLAVQKGCDGVDPDNVNGYINNTGFPLSYNDQVAYNIWLADQAHAHGLSIGLKNDLEQIRDLYPFFDWALNEECFFYEECHLLLPFIQAKKPVFVIEYDLNPKEFCSKANELGFNAIQKNLELDSFHLPCK